MKTRFSHTSGRNPDHCPFFHYTSYKSRSVTRSSMVGETLDFVDGFDCALLMRHYLMRLFVRELKGGSPNNETKDKHQEEKVSSKLAVCNHSICTEKNSVRTVVVRRSNGNA